MRHSCATVLKLRLSGCQWSMKAWIVARVYSNLTPKGQLLWFCLWGFCLYLSLFCLTNPEHLLMVTGVQQKEHFSHWLGHITVHVTAPVTAPPFFNCKEKAMFVQSEAPVHFPSAQIWDGDDASVFRRQNPICIVVFFCVCRATKQQQNKEHCD